MPPQPYPKAVRRALRELAAKAHGIELGRELQTLEAEFQRWHAGEIDPFELNDRIHAFLQGPSRELYCKYRDCDAEMLVCIAICQGVLEESELPTQVFTHLQDSLDVYRDLIRRNSEEATP